MAGLPLELCVGMEHHAYPKKPLRSRYSTSLHRLLTEIRRFGVVNGEPKNHVRSSEHSRSKRSIPDRKTLRLKRGD
jgi:hypothetical protein